MIKKTPSIFLALIFGVFSLGSTQSNKIIQKTIDPQIYKIASSIYANIKATQSNLSPIIGFIDYRAPSNEKRFWIIDINKHEIILNTYVSHGINSGKKVPLSFSNLNNSHKTSLGAHLTGGTYFGKHGLSMKIIGLENGINNNSESRAIVLHSAWYTSMAFLNTHNQLGRSWGCPAVSKHVLSTIINTLKNGHLFIQYSNDSNYLSSTRLIDKDTKSEIT
jgi:hypothetical protein